MEVFRQELNAYPLRALFDQASKEIGEAELESVLQEYGVRRKELESSTAWISVAFVDAILRDIQDRLGGDAEFLDRAARGGVSPSSLGPLFPLVIGFASPLYVYRRLPRGSAHLDKLGQWEVEESVPGHVRLRWMPHEGQPFAPFLCRFRAVQLSQVPTLFSRPPAQVAHPACLCRGDSACVYELTWHEGYPRLKPALGAVAGTCGALLLAFTGAPHPVSVALLTPLLVAGGWALGKVWTLRWELSRRVADIESHNRALEEMTRRNEERYAELLEAKHATDAKVEERTRELRITAQQLSETLAQVQALDRAKTDFFSNVSHELRTPLTLLLGPLGELAAGGEPTGGMARAVEVMHRNGLRLLELINQLLDLSRIDAGKLELTRVPTDPAELARLVASRFVDACAQRDVELHTAVTQVAPITVDPTWTESALSNLVANAVRFAEKRVMLRVRDSGATVVFEVEDDGPGIAPEDIHKVFDRFVQGSDAKARHGGTGLGLAIAREAARLHGGDVSVRSVPGKATTFTLTLPRVTALADVEARGASAPKPTPSSRPSAIYPVEHHEQGTPRLEWPGPDPNAPLVLLVEDNADVSELVGGVLASTYRVRVARDGEEGLALASELMPDVVVSDVVMPGMDGYELCRRLRARNQTRAIPILLLTARTGVDPAIDGFEAGADDYITKPFHPRELLARVGVHVRLRRMVSHLAHRERLVAAGVLAASLAHQVRTPLTVILAGLPVLEQRLSGVLKPRDLSIMQAMVDGSKRIERLIADLLNLSRVDRDGPKRFNPADGVRAAIRLLQARAATGVRIESDLADSIELEGRPGDVGHVFVNLIDNAMRAAAPAGRVQVRTFTRDGSFVFEVGDSGPGIPEGKEETIFAPFFTTRREGEGTGLGLPIAREVVVQHGGSIRIGRSDLGGALFTVELPIPTPQPAADQKSCS